jgi:proteasome lid subunit RPN8/RPN11
MSALEVELFRSDDYVRDGNMPLLPLLREVFEGLIGRSLAGCRFELLFLPVADRRTLSGSPSVVNLRSSHGYVQVRILQGGEVLYQHPHPVREIIGRPLQLRLLDRTPGETHWGFGVRGPGLDRIALVRPAPEVANQVDITVGLRRPRVFHLEEVEEPEPPLASLAELGADAGDAVDSPVGVVAEAGVALALTKNLGFSSEVEEGGFLAGHVYRDRDNPGRDLVKVSGALPAMRTGASLLHFTFTGESFLRVSETLAARGRGERLVGWYHTHLFRATDSLGLSTVDVDLHTSTFHQPWQIAALVNIAAHGDDRVLRFYRASGKEMVKTPYWVAEP